MPVIPATGEAEAGESIEPLFSSLDDRLHLKKKIAIMCYFCSLHLYMYFQGEGRIRPDFSGAADLGESIEGKDKTCLGRAHLSPDKDCNDHR